MTAYLSPDDRLCESYRAEDRSAEIPVSFTLRSPASLCPWCKTPSRKHSAEALARCEAAFEAEMNRRLAGPVQVRDMAGWRA